MVERHRRRHGTDLDGEAELDPTLDDAVKAADEVLANNK